MNILLPDLPAATAHPIDTLRAAPAVSEALAQRLAAEHYGLIAAVHRLDSERDQNFRLRSLSGREFVLKIASPTEDRAVTNLQTEALLHLAATEPDLPVPRIFPARNGMTELDVTLEDGSARVVRLLSFLPGTPMHAVTGSATLRRDLGRCAARLARGLSDFSHGGANHKLLWDLQHAAELRPLLDAVQAERRGLVEDALGRFEAMRSRSLRNCRPSRSTTTSTRTTSSSILIAMCASPESSILAISPAPREPTISPSRQRIWLPIATIP
jgi:hydroxylysine kinase